MSSQDFQCLTLFQIGPAIEQFVFMSAIRKSWLFRIPHKTAGKSYSSTKQKQNPY